MRRRRSGGRKFLPNEANALYRSAQNRTSTCDLRLCASKVRVDALGASLVVRSNTEAVPSDFFCVSRCRGFFPH